MHRGIQMAVILIAAALLYSGVGAAAEAGILLETTDGFYDSLIQIFTDFFENLRALFEA